MSIARVRPGFSESRNLIEIQCRSLLKHGFNTTVSLSHICLIRSRTTNSDVCVCLLAASDVDFKETTLHGIIQEIYLINYDTKSILWQCVKKFKFCELLKIHCTPCLARGIHTTRVLSLLMMGLMLGYIWARHSQKKYSTECIYPSHIIRHISQDKS